MGIVEGLEGSTEGPCLSDKIQTTGLDPDSKVIERPPSCGALFSNRNTQLSILDFSTYPAIFLYAAIIYSL
jgi:hypothetical protein